MSSHMVKRKSQGKATSTLTNIKRVQRSGEDAKQLFPKECRISIYIWAIKIKYKKLFRRLLTLQTSVDAIVRLTNIKEGGDILKIVSHGKFLEREFMVRDKCCREYTRSTKDVTVRWLKFHIKNVNTKDEVFFTISVYNSFLEIFWVKLIWVIKHHFWDTKQRRPSRTTLLASQSIRFTILKFLILLWKFRSSFVAKSYHWPFLQANEQDWNDRKASIRLDERLQIKFLEPTATKVFYKLSAAVSVKHTSYNWRNGEATYLVLLSRYWSFDIHRNLFYCKIHFAWYEISFCFSFFVIYTMTDSLERIDPN